VIITKLQVTLVELVVSSQSSSSCRASRARRVERVELCCSNSSTQPKCMGSTRVCVCVWHRAVVYAFYWVFFIVSCGSSLHAYLVACEFMFLNKFICGSLAELFFTFVRGACV